MNWAIEHAKKLGIGKGVDAFGVVLFDKTHGNVVKVLYDRAYWEALDEASGDRWQIFAATGLAQAASDVTLERMRSVDRSPNDNRLLLDDFGIASRNDLPCLVIFAQDKDGETLRVRMRLRDDTLDGAFQSLRETIGVATRAIEQIDESNFKNTEGVFAALDFAVASYKEAIVIKKLFPFVGQIAQKLLSKGSGG